MGSGRLFRVGVGDYRGEVIKLVVVVVMGVIKIALKSVGYRLEDELDDDVVDVLHVLGVPVLQHLLHRLQKGALHFLRGRKRANRTTTEQIRRWSVAKERHLAVKCANAVQVPEEEVHVVQ
ncbi:hypothetical protein TYRP_002780 [Tyrophagus putrescentiae]|nr:hypothetical protein TYRP_002780 [Tyrophagus putrescentiae]